MKAWLLLVACAAGLSAAQAADWTLSGDGAFVIDVKAKLAWPRCVEGMVWDGRTCGGKPQLFDHAEAQALATARWKAENVRWRLPTSHELQRLYNRQATPPGVDPQWFPASPPAWHWSGSTTVKTGSVNPYSYGNVMQGQSDQNTNRLNFLHGWAVDLASGEAAGDVSRRNRLAVRLVRPAF